MAYAVHTATCTYLLDDDGVCRWVVSPQGLVPAHVQQCIGAQFVACLDVSVDGGLVGELQVGARALFVRHGSEGMMLMRTGPIQHVDDRREDKSSGGAHPSRPPPAAVHQAMDEYGKKAGVPYQAKPPPRFGVVESHGEEQTITVATANFAPPRTERLPNDLDPRGDPG